MPEMSPSAAISGVSCGTPAARAMAAFLRIAARYTQRYAPALSPQRKSLEASPPKSGASAAARSNLPATGALGLLMVSNPVQEFTIHSTSVSEASGGAVVLVEMKADGVQTIRIFNLIVENGVWVIHSIDFAPVVPC